MKHSLTVICALAMVFCLASVGCTHFSGIKICLDPGHGGSDPGAVGNGLQEKTINLDIANRAKGLFQQDGATVISTRTSDVSVSLQGRCDIANNNGAHRFISSHCNAGGGVGTETFCHPSGSSNSYDLRNKINPELVAHMGTSNRGVKTADFYVLRNTSMPAILAEVAFIDNAGDAAKLASAAYRQEAGRAYLHGTQAHYGQTVHDPVSDIIIDNTSGSFYASGNWATGTSSTDKYGSNYRFRSTAAVSDPARWTPNIPSAGNWKVYAWWPAGTNRSPSAPYIVTSTGGNTTVKVNQQVNGGTWNYLGTFSLGAGTGYPTSLSCWTGTGYVVMADAIKWVKQ